MRPSVLHTARLVLSVPTPTDAPAMASGADDPENARWTPLPSPYRVTDAEAFIEQCANWWRDDHHRNWAIRADGEFVGMIGLTLQSDGVAEVGYWLAPAARGNGYAAEALDTVVSAAFDDGRLALRRLIWQAGVGNIASARAAQRVGFRFEGTQRMALTTPRTVRDGWLASLLRTDERTPQYWPLPSTVPGPGGTRLRSVDDTDFAAIVRLWETAGLTRPWNDPWLDIDRAVGTDRNLFIVAVDHDDHVVGTVLAGYDGHRGWLYYLATAPDRRGEGIGAALVAEAERRLRDRGCPKVHLMVRPENPGVHNFYVDHGYAPFDIWIAGKWLSPATDASNRRSPTRS